MTFFTLETPRDMLNKARRERERLRADVSIDHVFNFFVTANHIADYIKKSSAIPPSDLETFLALPQLKQCRDLCDKAKHMRLTHRRDPATRHRSGMIGAGMIGNFVVGSGEEWTLVTDGVEVDVLSLSENVLEAWEQLFRRHAL